MTDYYDFTPKQFEDILVHEMIHYYLAYFGLDKSCSHGCEFKKMAKRLNETYDLNITKYLDISQYKKRRYANDFVLVGTVVLNMRSCKDFYVYFRVQFLW